MEVLGEGGTATVYKSINSESQIFAIQVFEELSFNYAFILAEVKNLSSVNSQYILRLATDLSIRQDGLLFIILEYCNGGAVAEYLCDEVEELDYHEIVRISHDLAHAIKEIHNLNILHGDIKLENILIHKTKEEKRIYKLANFGLSSKLESMAGECIRTNGYQTPEIFENQLYDIRGYLELGSSSI